MFWWGGGWGRGYRPRPLNRAAQAGGTILALLFCLVMIIFVLHEM